MAIFNFSTFFNYEFTRGYLLEPTRFIWPISSFKSSWWKPSRAVRCNAACCATCCPRPVPAVPAATPPRSGRTWRGRRCSGRFWTLDGSIVSRSNWIQSKTGWWFGCHLVMDIVIWLVVIVMNCFLFSHWYWEFLIIPIDELIFFRGVQTNHQPENEQCETKPGWWLGIILARSSQYIWDDNYIYNYPRSGVNVYHPTRIIHGKT